MDRFERQVILPGFGSKGQEKLKNSSVLVIGAGGLGCPILLYLAAAGVGRIGIVDGDEVTISNLNRQVLYGERDLGKKKAEVVYSHFSEKYKDIQWEVFSEYLIPNNAPELISGFDLIVDGSDNFPTRYLVNDACVLLNKPLVFGAIYQHEGQVSVFNVGENACNYRDLFAEMPAANEIPNCSETGVIGVLPGIIGNLMALEAIKVLSEFGKPLKNKVLFFNSLTSESYTVELSPNEDSKSQIPKSIEKLKETNYELACEGVDQIDWEEAFEKVSGGSKLVDVRELGEIPKYEMGDFLEIPLSQLSERAQELENNPEVILFCQSGIRSQKAALILKSRFPKKKIYSIHGGIHLLN